MHKDTVKTVVRTAQNVYLGTMFKIVFFNASLTARMLFGMIRPFLSQRAQNKIQFVSSEQQLTELGLRVDQLPQQLGGTSQRSLEEMLDGFRFDSERL